MGKSKTETKQQQTVTPTNPAFVTRAVQDQQQRINELAQRDPREFVAPSSPLQNASFALAGGLANRMNGSGSFDFGGLLSTAGQTGGDITSTTPMTNQPVGQPEVVQVMGERGVRQNPAQGGTAAPMNLSFQGEPDSWSQSTTPSLTASPFGAMRPEAAGMIAASDIGQPDYAEYVRSQPDLLAEYNDFGNRPGGYGFGPNLPATYDANGNGRVDIEEYGRFHNERFGVNEPNRTPPPTIGGPSPSPVSNQPVAQRDAVTGAALGNVGAVDLASPDPNDMFRGAGLLAGNVGLAGANEVGSVAQSQAAQLGPAAGYQAAGPANVATYNASGPASVTQAGAVTGRSSGMAPIMLGQASLLGDAAGYSPAFAAAQGFDPAQAGAVMAGAQGYDAVTGQASRASGGGYNAAQAQAQGYDAAIADLANLPTARAGSARAAQIEQSRIDALRNPYEQQVVDATLADFDVNAERTRAQQAAQAAGAGAFGGSRFGVREAVTEGELARARAAQQAGLLADSYNFAAGLANEDAGRQQQASITNANNATQAGIANANIGLSGLLANVDALNQAGRFNAQAFNDVSLANAGMSNDARRFGADAANQASRLNAQLGTQASLANADSINRAAEFGADAFNRAGLQNAQLGTSVNLANMDAVNNALQFTAAANNQAGLANAGFANEAGRFNAGAANDFALADQAAANQFGLANMDAFNRAGLDAAGRADAMTMGNMDAINRARLANADAFNRSSLDFAGRSDAAGQFGAGAMNQSLLDLARRLDSAGQFNASAANQFGLAQFDADTQANFRNADALNNMNMFNAGQRDNMLQRQLAAAGLLGDLGATVGSEDRANIGLLADLGNQQREIDRAYRNAEPTMAELLGQLQAMQQFGLFQGQNSQGTSTTTERGSTLDQIGQVVGIASALGGMMPGGGGKVGKVGKF